MTHYGLPLTIEAIGAITNYIKMLTAFLQFAGNLQDMDKIESTAIMKSGISLATI